MFQTCDHGGLENSISKNAICFETDNFYTNRGEWSGIVIYLQRFNYISSKGIQREKVTIHFHYISFRKGRDGNDKDKYVYILGFLGKYYDS